MFAVIGGWQPTVLSSDGIQSEVSTGPATKHTLTGGTEIHSDEPSNRIEAIFKGRVNRSTDFLYNVARRSASIMWLDAPRRGMNFLEVTGREPAGLHSFPEPPGDFIR